MRRRLGIRRPLGQDMRGRRYWVMGGAAGAWCVFVEGADGRQWGWYEGEPLVQLLHWVRKGDVEEEESLLKVGDWLLAGCLPCPLAGCWLGAGAPGPALMR
jgi:hypothetical protein